MSNKSLQVQTKYRDRETTRAARPLPRKKRKGHLDATLVIIIIFLLVFGLIILYSASYYEASMSADCNNDPAFYFKKQGTWMLAGLFAMFGISYVPYRIYPKFAIATYVVSLILVGCCTMFPAVNGARRWVYFGGFSLQPAEIVKIAVILVTATFITRLGTGIYQKRTACFILGFPLFASIMLYFVTDNLSSAIIVFAIAVGMFFVARRDYAKFVLFALIGIVLVVIVVYAISLNIGSADSSFRMRRIVAWLDPEGNSDSWSFQTMQALYAIGSGGLFGKGLGRSMQKLGYIPEVQNDMIFSVICEELGIVGAVAIIAMFGILCYRLYRIASDSRDVLGSYIVVGVFCHISVQAILNIAVVTNTIPNTGVSLPFISYGGSAVFFTLAEMGMALSVSRYSGGDLYA